MSVFMPTHTMSVPDRIYSICVKNWKTYLPMGITFSLGRYSPYSCMFLQERVLLCKLEQGLPFLWPEIFSCQDLSLDAMALKWGYIAWRFNVLLRNIWCIPSNVWNINASYWAKLLKIGLSTNFGAETLPIPMPLCLKPSLSQSQSSSQKRELLFWIVYLLLLWYK